MRYILALSILTIVCWSGEAEPVKLPPDAQAAIDKADKAISVIQSKADAEIAKVRQDMIKALTKAQEAATKKGDLNAALAIKAKIDEVPAPDAPEPVNTQPVVKGWANVTVSASDNRYQIAPARIDVIAILNTGYAFTNVPETKPECSVMQIPQFYKTPLTITAASNGKILIFGALSADKIIGMLPKETKPSVATGEVSAPGVVGCVSCVLKAGTTFVLDGSELRVLAGKITRLDQ